MYSDACVFMLSAAFNFRMDRSIPPTGNNSDNCLYCFATLSDFKCIEALRIKVTPKRGISVLTKWANVFTVVLLYERAPLQVRCNNFDVDLIFI